MELFYQNTVQKASSFAWNFRNQRLQLDPGGNSDAGLTLSAAGRIVDTLKAAIEAMLLFP